MGPHELCVTGSASVVVRVLVRTGTAGGTHFSRNLDVPELQVGTLKMHPHHPL